MNSFSLQECFLFFLFDSVIFFNTWLTSHPFIKSLLILGYCEGVTLH